MHSVDRENEHEECETGADAVDKMTMASSRKRFTLVDDLSAAFQPTNSKRRIKNPDRY